MVAPEGGRSRPAEIGVPKMILRTGVAWLAALLLVWAAPLPAAAQVPGMTPVALSSDMVGNFIESFPKLKEAAEALSRKHDVRGGGDDPVANFGAFLAYRGAIGELDAATRSHGFSGFMDWLQVMSSVATAYMFSREGGGMDRQMAEAMKQIESNPNLTPDQKAMMRQQMQASLAAVAAMRPPQQNLDAVAPHVAALEVLFEKGR